MYTFSIYDYLKLRFAGWYITWMSVGCYLYRYPPERFPVLAFKGAPAHFPVEQRNLGLQQYVVWSDDMLKKANDLISEKFSNDKYIGIHLRLGSDFVRAL